MLFNTEFCGEDAGVGLCAIARVGQCDKDVCARR